ncbi:MAG TPA: formylglycine-generating enzyme family protein, partial [Pirellulales bacterium]|nr:formylglycine-generating enzyme family protein [Pirellulales bacterium]
MARELVAHVVQAPSQFARLLEAVRPARNLVVPPLVEIFNDPTKPERELLLTTSLLLELAGEQPNVLADMLMHADAQRFASIMPVAKPQAAALVPIFQREIETFDPPEQFRSEEQERAKDQRADRQAKAALAVFCLGHEEAVWPLLRQTADPRRRTFMIDRLASYGIDAQKVIARLAVESDVSCRRALLLGLGEYSPQSLSAQELGRVAAQVQAFYRDDPDPGVHGAAQWLLEHWGRADLLRGGLSGAAQAGPSAPPAWYVNGEGHTMVVVPGPAEFFIDLLESRDREHRSLKARIDRPFAIGSTEVTIAQYARSLGIPAAPDEDLVQSAVSWYDAVRYCNWLSQAEGIPQDQWCYVAGQSGEGSEIFEAAADFSARTGYRLPTEAEWDYACRAGTVTPRFYGNAPELLSKYAWYYANSEEQRHAAGLLKPNDWGLFDVYGNVWEWCHDVAADAMPSVSKTSDVSERVM